MPLNKYIKIKINKQELELQDVENQSLNVNYALENSEDFQEKASSTMYALKVPASTKNDKILNTLHNAAIEDMTDGQLYKGNMPASVECNGQEVLIGRAFLISSKSQNGCPIEYTINVYGNNADWLIDLAETTLFDLYQDMSFVFTKELIENSWDYDGRDPSLPYVFAPVKYGLAMDTLRIYDNTGTLTSEKDDYNMVPTYMKPSLSKYWSLFRGFKLAGYKIKSDFFDTDYFRRQVMPWTWGNFLESGGTALDNLNFLAKGIGDNGGTEISRENESTTEIWDVNVSNDSFNGGFDNNNTYTWDPVSKSGKWTYPIDPTLNYGTLLATFHFNAFIDSVVTANSDVELRIQYYKNGVRQTFDNDNGNGTLLKELNAPTIGRRSFIGQQEHWATFEVNPGDVISFQIYLHMFHSGAGIDHIHLTIDAWEIAYFRIPLGGTIDFANFTGLKKWKFLDMLGGICDEFDLVIQTDPINKIIYIEPQHDYSLINDQSVKSGGYFNGKLLDWTYKEDLSKESEMILFSDYAMELDFKYKDDTNDGTLKKVQDRNVNTLALAKYLFPTRFKNSTNGDQIKKIENRFFAPLMHLDMNQWEGIANDYPQMPALIPENISNTSADEAQNTFEPKSAYYKGIVSDWGWVWDGDSKTEFPYMFAVNYRQGGEDDPILSYADEIIWTDKTTNIQTIGKGLMRRFFLQRLAIMSNGQYLNTWFHLNNNDIMNFLHREYIICRGQKWELIGITDYPLVKEDSCAVSLRKWSPITHL